MPDQPNPIPEGLELRPDGTAIVVTDDGRITLRRPKLSVLRGIRQMEWDIADGQLGQVHNLEDELDKLRIEAAALKGEDPDHPRVRELIREVNRLSVTTMRRLTLEIEEQRLEWAVHVIATLAGREVEGDDLPPWCSEAKFAADLMNHWKTVPIRHGGR